MKALIFAAGFGTRLMPYTQELPKPLFTLQDRPILGHVIEHLIHAGCDEIVINTHHLHDRIERFISKCRYDAKIHLVYEPEILETGGAIANTRSFFENDDFIAVNADVISDIDLHALHAFHQSGSSTVTMALHHEPRFNKIGVDSNGFVTGFSDNSINALAFTGIQVISPEIYNHLPDKQKFSSIEVYKELCMKGKVKAFVDDAIFWSDIGSPEDYWETSVRMLCRKVFSSPEILDKPVRIDALAGDGSDRKWYRAETAGRSAVISDHGICLPDGENEKQLNAFFHIGSHLKQHGMPVPQILAKDTVSGMVLLEDLGSVHLADQVLKLKKEASTDSFGKIELLYQSVIRELIRFSQSGIKGFDPDWTCQTRTYDKALILEKECGYFMDAFINGYLGLSESIDTLQEEFIQIADSAIAHQIPGLMHRDMQSRNIMIRDLKIYFIDFQGARLGPLQYDLASLLIDPYVNLNSDQQEKLIWYTADLLGLKAAQKQDFLECYEHCCLARNLQVLGAFSFLSRIRKKTGFEQYIPGAMDLLDQNLQKNKMSEFPKLRGLVQKAKRILKE